jgi:WG repeat protein
MRAALLLLAACGAKPAAPPSNAQHGSAQVATPAKQDCTARIEKWKPGNVDRFSFEDPLTHRYGYKDGKGAIVIAPSFVAVYEFAPAGMAAAVDGTSPFVFIDRTGKVVARAYSYDNGPDYFQEGLARIIDASKRIGYMTERGDIAIAPQFDTATSFCHGKAEVAIDFDKFYIDTAGHKTTPPPRDPD